MTSGAADPSIVRLAAEGTTRRYPQGALLFAEGDPSGPVFIVVKGEIALVLDGDEKALGTSGAGELIGELSAIDHLPRSASAIATTDVEVRAIPAARFTELLDSDSHLARFVTRTVASRLRGSTEVRTLHVGGLPVGALAQAILARIPSGSEANPMAEYVADLATSHEQVSRAIDYLVACGAIVLDRGRIVVVDARGLERVAARAAT